MPLTAFSSLLLLACLCTAPECASPEKGGKAWSMIECGRNSYLPAKAPAVHWCRSAGCFERLYKSVHAGARPLPGAPGLDFEKYGVLFLSAGTRPAAGYSLEVSGALLKDGSLELALELDEPPKGAMTAQIITRPYCMVSVDKGAVENVLISSGLDFPHKSIDTRSFPEFEDK